MPPKKLAPTEVKMTTMDPDLVKKAVEIAENAARTATTKKDMASQIKKSFDKLGKGTFQCIVGRDYGSYVNHEPGCFIFMYVDAYAVLLFRGKVNVQEQQQESG